MHRAIHEMHGAKSAILGGISDMCMARVTISVMPSAKSANETLGAISEKPSAKSATHSAEAKCSL